MLESGIKRSIIYSLKHSFDPSEKILKQRILSKHRTSLKPSLKFRTRHQNQQTLLILRTSKFRCNPINPI